MSRFIEISPFIDTLEHGSKGVLLAYEKRLGTTNIWLHKKQQSLTNRMTELTQCIIQTQQELETAQTKKDRTRLKIRLTKSKNLLHGANRMHQESGDETHANSMILQILHIINEDTSVPPRDFFWDPRLNFVLPQAQGPDQFNKTKE